ncbi:MAG: exodeoxyribonuclease VII small subunit [Candidatus Nanogingivalis sp.]
MSNKNNLENKIQQVDEILAKIESGEIPLEKISGEYKKAVDLAQEIEIELNQMKNEIEIISKDFSQE